MRHFHVKMLLFGLCTLFCKVTLFSLPEVFCGPQKCVGGRGSSTLDPSDRGAHDTPPDCLVGWEGTPLPNPHPSVLEPSALSLCPSNVKSWLSL